MKIPQVDRDPAVISVKVCIGPQLGWHSWIFDDNDVVTKESERMFLTVHIVYKKSLFHDLSGVFSNEEVLSNSIILSI